MTTKPETPASNSDHTGTTVTPAPEKEETKTRYTWTLMPTRAVLPNLLGGIPKLGDVRWVAEINEADSGRNVWRGTAPTREAASTALEKARAALRERAEWEKIQEKETRRGSFQA